MKTKVRRKAVKVVEDRLLKQLEFYHKNLPILFEDQSLEDAKQEVRQKINGMAKVAPFLFEE